MAQTKLFDRGPRSDSAPKGDVETSYEFLNRRAGAFWDRVRNVLEDWYAEYPDDTNDMRNRFCDKDERQHLAAWWEIYVYTIFRRLGYDVEIHPALSDSPGNPDFLVSRGSISFYVECLAMFNDDGTDNPAGRAWICECTNRAKHPDFMVNLDIEQIGTDQPGVREITGPLEEWLATLDADVVATDVETGKDLPRFELGVRDWKLVFEAWPVAPEKRGNPRRIIALYPTPGAVMIKDVDEIRKRLGTKGAKYGPGKLEKPLVVALLCWNAVDDDDLKKALFGSTVISFIPEDPESFQSVRIPDGYWRPGTPDRSARGGRISAVLFGNYLRAWRVADMLPQIWINPCASTPIPDIPPFGTLAVDSVGNFVSGDPTRTGADIFELTSDWPN